MKIELLSITPNSEKVIELAGRTAYQSQDKITEKSHETFIKNLIGRGHTSVIEHASASFLISGISRSCSHQLVRHRLASFTQKSQRFCNENNFEYVIPDSIKNDINASKIFINAMNIINRLYRNVYELGIKKEDCRYLLPEACVTELVMTANFREWRHIIQLRTNKVAQWEIRELCQEILKTLKEKAPSCFGDL